MIQLLVWKDWLRNLYRRYARVLLPVIRFLLAFAVFMMINGQIGYEAKLTKLPVVLGLSFFSAFPPTSEGAFRVTKQFAFHEIFRYCSTVDLNKRRKLPVAEGMDGMSH